MALNLVADSGVRQLEIELGAEFYGSQKILMDIQPHETRPRRPARHCYCSNFPVDYWAELLDAEV